MIYIAKVKTGIEDTIIRSVSQDGIQLIAGLFPGQIWRASKKGHYWYLTRQKSNLGIRLTKGAMKKWFEIIEE